MSDAFTNEPSGEDPCIRQVAGCKEKAVADLKRFNLVIQLDLMGLANFMVGYERSVVVDSCLLSIVTSLWISLCAPAAVLRIPVVSSTETPSPPLS